MNDLEQLDSLITGSNENLNELIEKPAKRSESTPVQLSDEEYYNFKGAWSNSMANELMENEVLFDAWFKGFINKTCDDKFSKGQYLHDRLAKLFSGGEYISEQRFVIIPKLDMRTKAGKAKLLEITDGVDKDKVYFIDEEEVIKINTLCDEFYDSKYSLFIRNNTDTLNVEQAFIRDYKGIKLKGKLDIVFDDKNTNEKVIVDWKTTSFFSDFSRKAKYSNYDRQAAWYKYISGADKFYFVVFDTVNYNRFAVYEVGRNTFESGKSKMDYAINYISKYVKNGINSDFFIKKML